MTVFLMILSWTYPQRLEYILPDKLAITEDKPIILDYWTDSLGKMVLIGVEEKSGEKLVGYYRMNIHHI